MKAIQNIDEAWNEVKNKTGEMELKKMEAPRRTVQMQRQVLEDIPAVIEGSEPEDVEVVDIEELVTTYDEPLGNEDLFELQNNPINNEEKQVEESFIFKRNTKCSFKNVFRFGHIAEHRQ
ncbi:unnamed protein product [Parnassius apollo]|uniref:(apollo) hypothetical protein n=1 Tax=Parnassius apollo TaxID=110799 RepID=A0A8S3W5G0_PARAO|nr:unnamed protein product [Parnassius apollo]